MGKAPVGLYQRSRIAEVSPFLLSDRLHTVHTLLLLFSTRPLPRPSPRRFLAPSTMVLCAVCPIGARVESEGVLAGLGDGHGEYGRTRTRDERVGIGRWGGGMIGGEQGVSEDVASATLDRGAHC
jgi:hypothetical protein